MSPAFIDTGAPGHTPHMPSERHPLQNPNPNGKFSSHCSSNRSGFHSDNLSNTMNSSNVGHGAAGFSSSDEIKSNLSFNSPSIPQSGSGLSRPRLSKVRKPLGSRHPRSASNVVPETGANPGFNPFRTLSENANLVSSGLEMSDKNEAFVFGANQSDASANLDAEKWGSGGSLDKEVEDGMRKLKIGSEKGIWNANDGVFYSNASGKANLNVSHGLYKGGFAFEIGNKKSHSFDESAVSELPGVMRKLNIGDLGNVECSEKTKDASISLSSSDKTCLGSTISDNVAISFGKSVESELPNEFKKLNVEDTVVLDGGSHIFNAGDTKKFVFGSSKQGSDSFLDGSSHILNAGDTKKIVFGSSKQGSDSFLDGGGHILNAGDTKKFVFGSSKQGSDSFTGSAATTLPDQMKNLNLKDSVNANVVEKNEVNNKTSDKTSFGVGSNRSTTASLGGRAENMLSNKMGNMKIGSETGDFFGRTDLGFSSPRMLVKEMQSQNSGDKLFHNVGKSIPTEVTFQTGMLGKDLSGIQVPIDRPNDESKLKATTASSSSFSSTGLHFQPSRNLFEAPSMARPEKKDEFRFTGERDDIGMPHVDFKTPNQKENSSLNQKLLFSAKREAAKDTRSKKRRGKFRQPAPVQLWIGQDFAPRESSSQENPGSPVSYSPMDVSPYQEMLADNQCSRETSVTSDDSFHLDNNYPSTDSRPMVSNDATDEDLVSTTQHLDINEGDVKCNEMKEKSSEYHFNEGAGAEGPLEEAVSGAETASFKSAIEEVDNGDLTGTSAETVSFKSAIEEVDNVDLTVTSAETESGFNSNIEKQTSDGRTQFCFASISEDVGGSNFTFSASSSAQDQSSAMRHYKMKPHVKVGPDPYNSTQYAKVPYASPSPQFFPFSGTSSLLSPGQSQKRDQSDSQRKGGNASEVNKGQVIKQESVSTSAATVAAQEACEKWRLRGNQAYANGDLSKAEDYYTRGVNCVSRSETSRSCLRALVLCYSNRAATRMSLGRMREALEDCMLAAAVDPSFLKVQVRAANCYLALGEVEEASRYFQKCLQSGSDFCADRKILVEASDGLQNAQKVSECMNQSAELLGRRTFNDAESALGVIAEALIISSYSEKLLEMKAEALFMLRKYEDAIQLCEQSLASAEKNSLSFGADGQLANLASSVISRSFSFRLWRCRLIFKSYFYLGKLEEALDLLEQEELRFAKEKNGSNTLESSIPLAVTVRGLLRHKAAGNEAFQSGRHAEAVEHYTTALSCNVESRPFAAICFCNRAAAYKALGQITDAIADCSLAIALDGNYLKAISRRASLFEMIRDYGPAASDLQRLVSLLTKQVEEKTNQSGASDRSNSCMKDLRQAQLRLSEIEETARKEIPLNLYLILGIEPSVTASEIKKAYRKAALRHHPDKAGQSLARSDNADDGLWKKIAEEVHKDADKLFKMIGEAYAVLSDPSKRARYDLEEEMRNVQKKGNGNSTSRTQRGVQMDQGYPFERSGNRRQWKEDWRSYGHSQSRTSEATRSNRYS